MPITDPSEQYFDKGAWRWNGAAWIPRQAITNFSSLWAEDLGGTKSGNGHYIVASSTVPAGEVWVVQTMSLFNDTGARGMIRLLAHGPVPNMALQFKLVPARYEPVIFTGYLPLSAGFYLRALQFSCIDGDLLFGGVLGYKMKVF